MTVTDLLTLIDQRLAEYGNRSLVSTDELNDLLLDLRSGLTGLLTPETPDWVTVGIVENLDELVGRVAETIAKDMP